MPRYRVIAKSAAKEGDIQVPGKKLALQRIPDSEADPRGSSLPGPGEGDITFWSAIFDDKSVKEGIEALKTALAEKRAAEEKARRAAEEAQRADAAADVFISNITHMDEASLLDASAWPSRKVQQHVLNEMKARNTQLLSDVREAAESHFAKLARGVQRVPAQRLTGSFQITSALHGVTVTFLRCVHDYHAKSSPPPTGLNLVRGEDLLDAVGKLSHMINSADVQADELPVVPTVHELFRSGAFSPLPQAQVGIFGPVIDILLENHFLNAQDLFRLALANKSFLYAFAFYPPTPLLADTMRQEMLKLWLSNAGPVLKMVNWDLDAPRRLAEERRRQEEAARPNRGRGALRGGMRGTGRGGAAPQRAVAQSTGLPFGTLTPFVEPAASRRASDLQALKKRLESALAADIQGAKAHVPWGGGFTVELELAGAVRVNFSQSACIHRVDTSGGADLTYQNIANSLEHDRELYAQQLQLALKDLSKVKNSFIGETCILLVPLEGTMNNLMVVDVPFASLLISAGKMTWWQALYTGGGELAHIPFASGKRAKPQSVMSKQAALLQERAVDFDRLPRHLKTYSDYEKYMAQKRLTATEEGYAIEREDLDPDIQQQKLDAYMHQEYELHAAFLNEFFPEIWTVPPSHQPLYAALVTVHYLSRVYGVSAELHEHICSELDRQRQ